jgi:di/tricarboxylate transporter
MLAPNPLTDDISPVPAQDTRRRRSIKLALGVCCVLLLSAGAGVVGWLSESPVAWRQDMIVMAAVLIFVSTYAVIAIGKLPGFYLDRAGAALLGASLMAATGLLSLDDAYRAIDVDTIALLLGMMIVVANVRLSGFFCLVNNWMTMRARHPLLLLAAVTLVSGFFSAFLVNDAICLNPLALVQGAARRRDVVFADLLEDLNAPRLGERAGNARKLTLGQGRHA